MSRPRGGFIGYNPAPAASAYNSAAGGIWTLREAEELKRAGTWPRADLLPTDISGLQLWLDASDASTLYDATTGGSLVAADGGVARWEDKSGNDRHATQSTAADRPVRKTSVQAGRDVLRFDGASEHLGFSAFAIPASHTVFSVFSRTSSGISSILVGSRYSLWWFTDDVIYQSSNTSFTTHGTANTDTGYFVSTTKRNSTTSVSVHLDGQLVSTVTTGTGVTNAASGNFDTVGRQGLGPFTYHNGDIAEIIMYNSALSDTDREAVENYLMAKWGIT